MFGPCILQRTKIISDLLISVSKAERQEARLKVRQDSLRLGNVGVIRYRWSIVRNNYFYIIFFYFGLISLIMNFRAGTVLSETWEDGQALKDLNAQLVCLIFFLPLCVFSFKLLCHAVIYLLNLTCIIMMEHRSCIF